MIPARNLSANVEPRDKRITIQSPATVQDGNGEMIPGWIPFAVVWASIDDVSGREYVAAGATQNSANTKIGIDYREGIVANMRVAHGTDFYNIESVLGQDHRSLLLMCKRLPQ